MQRQFSQVEFRIRTSNQLQDLKWHITSVVTERKKSVRKRQTTRRAHAPLFVASAPPRIICPCFICRLEQNLRQHNENMLALLILRFLVYHNFVCLTSRAESSAATILVLVSTPCRLVHKVSVTFGVSQQHKEDESAALSVFLRDNEA